MKRPAFQFYPGDWLRSTDLRACSVGARGLWIDMICLMHEGTPYGHLRAGGKDILPPMLARMVGASLDDVTGWLAELEATGVFSKDGNCILCRRMIRDERTRNARASGGIKSLNNPNVPKPRISLEVSLGGSLGVSPASAFASSSSKEKTKPLSGRPDVGHPKLNGHKSEAVEVLEFLNETAGKKFRVSDTNLDLIRHRMADGITADQLRKVIVRKCRDWLPDDKMRDYIRPSTLFNKMKCEQYIGELVPASEVKHEL